VVELNATDPPVIAHADPNKNNWASAARPLRIGNSNDMIPNASGADCCNVVSWLLYPKAS